MLDSVEKTVVDPTGRRPQLAHSVASAPVPSSSSTHYTYACQSSTASGPLHWSASDSSEVIDNEMNTSKVTARKRRHDDIPNHETIRYSDGSTEEYTSPEHPVHKQTGSVPILVFYPTIQQIKDFSRLLELIERTGAHRRCGIVKIVPPPEWNPRRNMKADFSDVNDYTLENPVVERIEGERDTYQRVLSVYTDNMTAKEYRKMANSAKYKPLPAALKAQDPVAIEQEFFGNILDREVIYGADTEGSLYAEEVEEINMNNLGTILDETKADGRIKGVNTVFLYFGMYKTTFPWHAEDMDLYSINVLLYGAPKYWFAIAPESADRFERLMASAFYDEFKHCKAFMRHKVFVTTPDFLRKYDIKFGTMMQRKGEIIFTFPKGYHQGFNLGYNIAESTNFASDRWIDYGKTALLCRCRKDNVQIDMKKYMFKYRPEEADRWQNYWYSNTKVRPIDQALVKPIFTPFVTIHPYKKILPVTDAEDENMSPAKKAKFDGTHGLGSANPFAFVMENFNSKLLALQGTRRSPRSKKEAESALAECSHVAAPAPDVDSKALKTSVLRRNHGLWARTQFALKEENDYNREQSKLSPHCAVCQYFIAPAIHKVEAHVPVRYDVVIRSKSMFTKQDTCDEMPDTSDLWTCSNCSVTVHACCYGIDANAIDVSHSKWKCDRCNGRSDHLIRSTSCLLCERRGGALIRTENGQDTETFVHISCVIMNRRALIRFDRSPLIAYVYPLERERPTESLLDYFPLSYTMEFGNGYERSAHQCVVCGYNREGLICCGMCKDLDIPDPTTVHASCAKAVGFKMEQRHFPRVASLVCDRHANYCIDKDDEDSNKRPLRLGEEVEVIESTEGEKNQNEETKPEGETVEGEGRRAFVKDIVWNQYAVVDFLDGTVSRDIPWVDVMSHNCIDCHNSLHCSGALVKVKWDDDTTYDAYFRGLIATRDYEVVFEDGTSKFLQRKHLRSLGVQLDPYRKTPNEDKQQSEEPKQKRASSGSARKSIS